ncbi:MAG TPA: aldehyde dehydrogenase [Xanthomonadaceae bacterium]|nr:aldehyde dehydrogenase [Xanthomonadaceae bacterium]
MTQTLHNLIGGRSLPALGEGWLEVGDPATGEVFARAPDGDRRDVDAAVEAAVGAFAHWSGLRGSERAAWMNRLADALEARSEAFAQAEARDTGKPLRLAREVEIPRAVANLRFFAAAATQFASESHHGEAGLNYTLRLPLGVVAAISPWNLPLYLFTWKIAPALAAGNCVVGKPSEVTPVTAWMLGELAREIGFPAGALNIVHGTGSRCGRALVEHDAVRAVSFTGSTAVGRAIAAHCGPALKKCTLELGGKNPTVIFADAPREDLLDTVVRASFQNSGQICLCGSRILVERELYPSFREAFLERVCALRVGDPMDPDTDMGPLVSEVHFDKVMNCIELARQEGAQVLCGGESLRVEGRCRNGRFVAPTVLEGLGPNCRTNTEEIFGPVVTLQPFDDEAHALALANAGGYGLAASIWTQHLARAHRMAAGIRAGVVWVNTWLMRDLRTPFGGSGDSGQGREGGFEAMRAFTEPRNVCIRT